MPGSLAWTGWKARFGSAWITSGRGRTLSPLSPTRTSPGARPFNSSCAVCPGARGSCSCGWTKRAPPRQTPWSPSRARALGPGSLRWASRSRSPGSRMATTSARQYSRCWRPRAPPPEPCAPYVSMTTASLSSSAFRVRPTRRTAWSGSFLQVDSPPFSLFKPPRSLPRRRPPPLRLLPRPRPSLPPWSPRPGRQPRPRLRPHSRHRQPSNP